MGAAGGAARGSLVNSRWVGSVYGRWHGRWVGGTFSDSRQGANWPGGESSRERKFQGANWPGSYWPIRPGERIGPGTKRLGTTITLTLTLT